MIMFTDLYDLKRYFMEQSWHIALLKKPIGCHGLRVYSALEKERQLAPPSMVDTRTPKKMFMDEMMPYIRKNSPHCSPLQSQKSESVESQKKNVFDELFDRNGMFYVSLEFCVHIHVKLYCTQMFL